MHIGKATHIGKVCSKLHGVMSDKALQFILNHSENIGSHDSNTSDSIKYWELLIR